MNAPLSALDELRGKYREMLAMRLAQRDGTEEMGEVRARMMALASRFPGALREIDELALDAIRVRIGELERALQRPDAVLPWMAAVALFHTLTRGALSAKRWLGGRRTITREVEEAFAAELHQLPFSADAREWTNDLASLAAPPEGRLTILVFGRVALAMGITASEARGLVFKTRA
jgi:hypothetical protein